MRRCGLVLGHFIPMDAATTPEKDTLNRMIASRFRRPLTATGALRNPWHGCSCARQRDRWGG